MSVVILMGWAALAGCAGHAVTDDANVDLRVHLVRQHGVGTGGLASARMLARYYRLPLIPRAERVMRLASASGELSSAELAEALEASGYRVSVFSGTLDHGEAGIFRNLDRGEPVIVIIGSSFMLVDGYGAGQMRLLDSKRGAMKVSADDFDRAWQDSGGLALVAVR